MDQVSFIRLLAALLVVVGLLFGLYWGLRRFSGLNFTGQNAAGDLRVKLSKQIDPTRKLAVVEWGDREHLLLLSASKDLLIAERETPPEPDDETDQTRP